MAENKTCPGCTINIEVKISLSKEVLGLVRLISY